MTPFDGYQIFLANSTILRTSPQGRRVSWEHEYAKVLEKEVLVGDGLRQRKKTKYSVDSQTKQEADRKNIINKSERNCSNFLSSVLAIVNSFTYNFTPLNDLYKHCHLWFVCMVHTPWHLSLTAYLRGNSSNLNRFIRIMQSGEYNCHWKWTF